MPTDKMEIIGEVTSITDEGDTLKAKIKESNGSEFEWKAFHASAFRGQIEIKKIYRFRVSLVHKDGRKWPYRNLDELVGPAEMPASGEMTSAIKKSGGGGGSSGSFNGSSNGMEVKSFERHSIEAGNAASMVIELIKAGIPLDDIPAAVEQVLKNADTIVAWYESKRMAPASAPASAPARSQGATAKTNGKPTNVGEFLTWCLRTYKLNRKDVEEILQSKADEITDFTEAGKTVKSWAEAMAKNKDNKETVAA